MSVALSQSPASLHHALQLQVAAGVVDPSRIPEGHSITRQEAPLLAEAIRSAPKLTTLRLSECHLDERGLQLLIDAAAEHPELEHLALGRNAISADSADVLADAVRELPNLKSLRLRSTGLGAKSIAPVLSAITGHPSLEWLNLGQNPLGGEAAHAISDTIRTLPNLQHFNMMDAKLSAEDAAPLAAAIREMPRLVTLHLHANPALEAAEPRETLLNALLTSPHPNLLSMKDKISDKRLEDMLEENDVQAYELRTVLNDTQGDFSPLRCADVARILDRLPLINHNQRDYVSAPVVPLIKAFIQGLPALGKEESPSPTRLMSEDSRKLTVLDNPATWRQFDTLADRMESAGFRVDSALLSGKNSRGETWLECGLASAPDKVVPALNARGIQLQADALLNGDEASPALNAAIVSGNVKPLFTEKNWLGGKPHQLQQVYDILPDALKGQVGLHSLKQQISSAQRAGSGIGR